MRSGGSSGSSAPGVTSPPGRPPLALVFSLTVTGILANTLVVPAVPDILHDFGVQESSAGLVVAFATLPGIVLAPVIGVLSDRYGRRAVLVPCLLLFGVAGLANAAAPSFAVLLVLRFVQGIGSAGLINLAVVIIGDHWTGVDRARVIGQNAAALTISLAVLPPLGGALADLAGWRAVFLPYGIALFTAAAVVRTLPHGARHDVSLGDQLRQAAPFLRQRRVVAVVVTGIVVFLLVFGLVLTVLPVYLHDRFGVGASGRGLLLGLPAISSTVVALSLGRLRARLGTVALVLAGSGFFVVSFLGMAAAPSLVLLGLALLLYGIGEGLAIPVLQDEAAGAAPAASRGAVVAIWVGGARAGQTVGPVLGGVGLDGIGAQATFAVGAGVALLLAGGQLWAGDDGADAGPLLPEPPA